MGTPVEAAPRRTIVRPERKPVQIIDLRKELPRSRPVISGGSSDNEPKEQQSSLDFINDPANKHEVDNETYLRFSIVDAADRIIANEK